jgi:hypothetical protein
MTNSNFGPLSGEALRAQQNEEVQELHRQLAEKDRVFENYRKTRGGLEVFFRRVVDSISPITPLPKLYVPESGKKKTEVAMVGEIADSHMGAEQKGEEIEGFNDFNPLICERRNMGFAYSMVDYANTLRASYKIHELHILMLGDLISGDIHQELLITNAFPSPVQVVRAAMVHAKQIAILAPHFEKIIVHFVSEDNHARLTKKPQSGEAGLNSMNYLVGKLLEAYIQKHTNVEFNIYPMLEKVISVNQMQYLITHGHQIRGWMGYPWYNAERKVGKETITRMRLVLEDPSKIHELGFHKMVHAHFHTNLDHPLWSCCASVQGTTAYDHKDGRYSEPGQPAWLVHPKYGEFARTNFRLKFYDEMAIE